MGTGQGSGGNVDLRSPVLVMRSSTISANAFGGDGGNIHIGTSIFLPSADSAITASSTLGIDGARRRAEETHQRAVTALRTLGPRADGLSWLSEFILNRSY